MKSALLTLLIAIVVACPAFSRQTISVLAPDGDTVEGAVAISPTDPHIVIAAGMYDYGYGRDPAVVTYTSLDGGTTWSPARLLPKTLDGEAVRGQADPVLAIDKHGVAYLAVSVIKDAMSSTIGIYRSTDHGVTWQGTDVSHTPAGKATARPWIAVDNAGGASDGTLYLVWSTLFPADLNFTSSRDGGSTWRAVKRFDSLGWPLVTAGADGTVYISHLATNGSFSVLASADSGETFNSPVSVAPYHYTTVLGLRHGPHQLAADVSNGPNRGNLYLIYPGTADQMDGGPGRVWFTRSTDRGATWSKPIMLDPTYESSMPSAAVDAVTGEVRLTWFTKLEYSFTAYLHTASSLDGGVTFSNPTFVGEGISLGSFIGNYNQLDARGGKALAIFSDSAGRLSVATIENDGTFPLLICGGNPGELCLDENLIRVTVHARDQRSGRTAEGVPARVNGLFGYFSLPDLTGNTGNPEVFVKVLDGGAVNGYWWIFYGGLTDLEYTVTVTDLSTGASVDFFHQSGNACGDFSTDRLPRYFTSGPAGFPGGSSAATVEGSACPANTVCLFNGRFQATLHARDQRSGKEGEGMRIESGSDLFGFFSLSTLTNQPENAEVFLKMIDARALDGKFWVFYSGLTDLEYTLTVTDTATSRQVQFHHDAGSTCGGFATDEF